MIPQPQPQQTPLLIGSLLADLGFGQQVIVAAMAGFIVWYGFRAMRIGRAAGGFVESLLKYGMAVGTFVTVGIFFGWVNPWVLLGDLFAGGAAFLDLLVQGAGWALDWLVGVV